MNFSCVLPYVAAVAVVAVQASKRAEKDDEGSVSSESGNAASILADDKDVEAQVNAMYAELEKKLGPGPNDIVVSAHFPTSANAPSSAERDALYHGEENEVLVNVRNAWDRPITVFSVSGAYVQPSDMSTLIKNVSQFIIHARIRW